VAAVAGNDERESPKARRGNRRKGGGLDLVGPAFPFYASDWLGSIGVALMSPEQEGGYIHLLAHEWNDRTCSLPDDEAMLAKLSRLGERWPEVSKELCACFVPHSTIAGRIINRRLFAIWQEARKFRKQARESGHRGGTQRWQKERSDRDSDPTREPTATPIANDSSPLSASALHSPLPKTASASDRSQRLKKKDQSGEDPEDRAVCDMLIEDIQVYTRENGRTRLYRRIIKALGPTRTREVLSRCKAECADNPGAYFTHLAKKEAADLGIPLSIGNGRRPPWVQLRTIPTDGPVNEEDRRRLLRKQAAQLAAAEGLQR
jgi:uncharacterized protein YdaU (DUF1376 family)